MSPGCDGGSTAEIWGTMPKAWTEGSIWLIAADTVASLPGIVLLNNGAKLIAAELGCQYTEQPCKGGGVLAAALVAHTRANGTSQACGLAPP